MEDKICIRRMTEEDIPQAVEIEKLCFSEPWTEGSYRSCFLRDGTQSWFYAAVREDCPEVRAGNDAAIRLYESEGFRTEGVRPRFYRDPEEDAKIMWRRKE